MEPRLPPRYEDTRSHALRVLGTSSVLLVIAALAGAVVSGYFFGFVPVILGATPIYMVIKIRCPDCRYRVLKRRFLLAAPEVCPQCGARSGEASA